MSAGASHFEFCPIYLQKLIQIKFALGIKSRGFRRVNQAVSANRVAAFSIDDHQVVGNGIVGIKIQASFVTLSKTFFNKNFMAQLLCFSPALIEPNNV